MHRLLKIRPQLKREGEWAGGAPARYLLSPLPQVSVLVMRVVGEDPACAQLDPSQELHAAGKNSPLRGVRAGGGREEE